MTNKIHQKTVAKDHEEKAIKKPIYTLDIETDPFQFGRFPKPFCVGIYDGDRFTSFWGENCIEQSFQHLAQLQPGIIYAHNGGRFDILYYLKYIVNSKQPPKALVINRRIVMVELPCRSKHTAAHQFRDSLAIFPFPLKAYQKEEIDYHKLEADKREANRAEIIEYLRSDCVYLRELCTAFHKRFGPKMTIGGTSMGEIQSKHEFQCLSESEDFDIRGGKDKYGVYHPGFYYGGRVQCFKKGVMRGTFNIYDVNSMYPHVMLSVMHPLSVPGWVSKQVNKHTCFLVVEGKNYGAFCTRNKGGISFDVEDGIFHTTIHEFNTAIEHGLFQPKRILKCLNFGERGKFAGFVNHFYKARQDAKKAGDKVHELMYKYVLNSGYGKFAQNPNGYREYTITESSDDIRAEGWTPSSIEEGELGTLSDGFIIWEKPSKDYVRYNVATAASITGAARAILLEAIAKADNPIYCDTDSIICKSLSCVKFSETELGAWKHDGKGTKAAIAGKKLYAIFNKKECIKMASKGVSVTPDEIVSIAQGETVTSQRMAPTMRIDGTHNFITRKVRMT